MALDDIDITSRRRQDVPVSAMSAVSSATPVAPRRVGTGRRGVGLVLALAGLGSWMFWLAWRVMHAHLTPTGALALALEFVAFGCGVVVTSGLWVGRATVRLDRRADDRSRPVPVLLAEALDIGDVVDEAVAHIGVGQDDTGEIAWARRGLRVLGAPPPSGWRVARRRALAEAAWAVVAVDGLRRGAAVLVLVAVLLTGSMPVDVPSPTTVAPLVLAMLAVPLSHSLLSGGYLRPGARSIWSLASVGAGLGRGVSRSTLPIRWAATMATVVTLNIAIALRGISDRWTHGLPAMEHDARVVAIGTAMATSVVGMAALRRMTPPELDGYGATRRLEETSVRRLALGLTTLVALVGLAAGIAGS